MKPLLKAKLTSLLFFLVLFTGVVFPVARLQAQYQEGNFSANDTSCTSYQCISTDGGVYRSDTEPWWDNSLHKCRCSTGDAVLEPPKLQQLELWFFRILYSIWAIIAGFSFLMLVYLGYNYMLRGGTNDEELVRLRKHIINYVIGFALVFLAIPILTTVFRVIGINKSVDCYNVNMPGFQFFFTEMCTDSSGIISSGILDNPCGASDPEGKTCPESMLGVTTVCYPMSGVRIEYKCDNQGVGAPYWIVTVSTSPYVKEK